MKRYFLGVAAVVLGTVAVGGIAAVQTVAAADPVTTVELPLFGAPLTLGITTDQGGAITAVAVDPADGTVATHLKPHKVVFTSANPTDATDVARVVIKSGHGGQSVSARVGSLADLSVQPGSWSGDVFGDGITSKVTFTIAAATDGTPDITGITPTGAAAVVGDVKYSSGDHHEGDDSSASARVSIKFTNTAGDQSRVLSIRVSTHDHDGKTSAQLSIGLSPIKGVAVAAETAAGPHTWTGVLCDNTTTATIDYTVGTDGSISAVTATPATAVVKTDNDKISVEFSDHESVFIKVRADNDMIKISAQKFFRCDSGDPTTNVVTSIPTPDPSDGNHNGGGNDHGVGHGGHRGGGGDKGGNHGGA